MLERFVIAAWGNCGGHGAEATLNRPAERKAIYYYRPAGDGIIACGEVVGQAFDGSTNKVFRHDADREFQRKVRNLKVLDRPLSHAQIRAETGHWLQCRGRVVWSVSDSELSEFLRQHFANVQVRNEEPDRTI